MQPQGNYLQIKALINNASFQLIYFASTLQVTLTYKMDVIFNLS